MDYVFLSVDPALTQEPRPDLLDKVLGALRTVPGLQVDRKVGRGPDRTRRVYFTAESIPEA